MDIKRDFFPTSSDGKSCIKKYANVAGESDRRMWRGSVFVKSSYKKKKEMPMDDPPRSDAPWLIHRFKMTINCAPLLYWMVSLFESEEF